MAFNPARFTRNAVVVVATIALGVLVWDKWIDPNVFPKRFGVVVDGEIYRSGELTPAATAKVVREHGIRTIVDLGAHELGSVEEHREADTADALGVDRVRFGLFGDGRGDPNRYVAALEIMRDPARQPVLVHCAAGSERTGCAVALYRVHEQGWDLDRAYAETLNYDHDTRDNPHLREMLDAWAKPIGAALGDGGVIPYDGPTRPQ